MEKTIVSALQFTATAALQNIYRSTVALEIWTSLLPLKSNSLKRKKVTETASTTILFRRLHSFGLNLYLKKKHLLNEELMIAIWNKRSRLKLTSKQIQHSSWPESGRHLWLPSSTLFKHTLQTSQWNDLSWWSLEDKKLSVDTIGQLHDDDIWLQIPEFISALLCYLNLSIPLRIKEQQP